MQYNVRQSEQAVIAAEKYLAATRKRLAKSSTDKSTPAADAFVIEPFQKLRSDVWKQGRGQWDYRNGHLTQTLVDEQRDCYLEAVQRPPARFTLRLRLRITGGTEGLVGVLFNRSKDGSRGEAVLLCIHEEQPGLRFFFEYGDERHFHDKYARELPIRTGEEYVLRIDVRDKLVNVYVNDLLQQAYEVTSGNPGDLRLLTINASAEFHHLRIDPLADDAPMVPAGTIPQFAAFAQLDKSHPSHLSLAGAVIAQSQLQFEINKAQLASYQATWAADFWKLLNAPAKDDEAAIKSHKTQLDELAVVAQTAQRQLTLAKARESRFKAEYELKNATARAEAGKQGDKKETEKLANALEGARKKVASTTKQVEAAEKSLQDPPLPKYQGLSGSYGSSSGRRLALARWFADTRNPLTARVAANPIWLRHFGRALV